MKMKKLFKNRYFLFGLICVVLFIILGTELAYLCVEKGDYYYRKSQERKLIKIKLRGVRGNIVDRNGIPLATNRLSHVVILDRQRMPSTDEQINQILARVIEIVESNGDGECLVYNLPIKYRIDKGFYYKWQQEKPDIQKRRYERFRSELGIKGYLSAEEAFYYLKRRYKIEEGVPKELALKIISFRIDIYMRRYSQYEPVRIAENVSLKTAAQIETFSDQLPGIRVTVEPGRYYPMGEIAAHIVGYTGKINDEKLKDEGYDLSKDRIGRSGVEKYAEKWLTGSTRDKQGELIAEVDTYGRVVRVLEEKLPKDGADVILTLDSRLQKAAYDILKEEIYKMQNKIPPYVGEKNEAYLAKKGAVVVLDVHTGEILAMVSYPSFDPNLFAGGISSDEYEKLSKDPASPLYPIAFQGKLAPGSVFKMVVGIAALMERKVTVKEKIYDRVQYTVYDKKNGPKCWRKGGHGYENIVDAIKHSCNYYFYTIADRTGIDAINKWAAAFGLTGRTGLEIEEAENIVANLDAKVEAERTNMWLQIKSILKRYGCIGDKLTERDSYNIRRLVDFELSEDRSYEAAIQDEIKIRNMLVEMGYFEDKPKSDLNNAAAQIRYVLTRCKRWYGSDTVMVGIGQSYTQVSPLGVARYIAALVNGGKVIRTHVIKEIVSPDGEALEETTPVVENQVRVKDEYMKAIRLGMWKVVNDPAGTDGGGTAVKYFEGMDPAITVGGKTGTAQTRAEGEKSYLYNTAWFAGFTPYENPEVAVVVAIPNGNKSGYAAYIARKVIEAYYKIKSENEISYIQKTNELTR